MKRNLTFAILVTTLVCPSVLDAAIPAKFRLSQRSPATCIAYGPQGQLLATGGEDGSVTLWYADRGEQLTRIKAHRGAVRAVAFSPDGGALVTAGDDRVIRLFKPVNGKPLGKLKGHEASVRALAFSKFGGVMASGSWDGTVRIWDPATLHEVSRHTEPNPIVAISVEPDGNYVLGASRENRWTAPRAERGFVVDLRDKKVQRRIAGHDGDIRALVMTSGGLIATGGADGKVIFHKASDLEYFRVLGHHKGPVNALALRDDEATVASASADKTVRFWDVRGDRQRARIEGFAASVQGLAFSPGGKRLATADASGKVVVWDVSSLSGKMSLPSDIEKLSKADELIAEGKYLEAIPLAKAALRSNSRNARAQEMLASLLLNTGKPKEGIAGFEKALKLDSKLQLSNNVQGFLAMNAKKHRKAVQYFKKVVRINPNNTTAHQSLAANYNALKKYAAAGQHNLLAHDISPSDATNMYNLACTYSLSKNADRALFWLEKAFQSDFITFDQVMEEPDFAYIKGSSRFQALVIKYAGTNDWFKTGGSASRGDRAKVQADKLRKANKFHAALKKYKEAIAIERSSRKRRLGDIRINMFWAGQMAWELDDHAQALKIWERCRDLGRHLGTDDASLPLLYKRLGGLYRDLHEYEKARNHLQYALTLSRKSNDEVLAALDLRSLGELEFTQGNYSKALEKYEEALAILKKTRPNEGTTVKTMRLMSNVYLGWGQIDKAEKTLNEALRVAKAIKDKTTRLQHTGLSYKDLALVASKRGQQEKAVSFYERQLATERELGRKAGISLALRGLALTHARLGHETKAIKYAKEAISVVRGANRPISLQGAIGDAAQVQAKFGHHKEAVKLFEERLQMARSSNKPLYVPLDLLGNELARVGRHKDALQTLEEALKIARQEVNRPRIAETLQDIARVLMFDLKRPKEAVGRLREAVQILEQLRRNTRGTARADFVAKQIIAYQFLVSAQLRTDQSFAAYQTMELSRAKLLAEKLATDASDVVVPPIPELQALAGTDGAILAFANVDWSAFAGFAINRERMTPRERNIKPLIEAGTKAYGAKVAQALSTAPARSRGIRRKLSKKAERTAHESSLEDLVHYYRSLLQNPSPVADRELKVLGRLFYDHFIAPWQSQLQGRKRLLIVPDGVLALLPFETFIAPNGKYLVELYDVRYSQSLSVLRLLQKRKHTGRRKPMLAMGGAVYEDTSGAGGSSLQVTLTRGGSLRNAYQALGYSAWDALPGSLDEVRSLGRVVRGSDTMTGADVSESRVRRLSSSGQLARYRVLHFATHGLVVPEHPEMSALVLSQFRQEKSGHDGYLRMPEIARLHLAADFVNLSACETGLGRIYGGEGVVGLAQAFLTAGANALSVSLWQVADESTAKMMKETYAKASRPGADFGTAFTEVKREFIRGKYGAAWKSPHYWAPFVYFGK